MSERSGLVIVGKIIKAFGLRGELKVHPEVFYEDFFEFSSFTIFLKKGGKREFKVENIRRGAGNSVIIKLEGVDTRELAEELRGYYLYVEPEDLKPTEKDEYYLFELLESEVIENGETVGIITDFILGGSNIVLVADLKEGEVFIPFTREYIKSIDTENKKIVVELPEELKELNR